MSKQSKHERFLQDAAKQDRHPEETVHPDEMKAARQAFDEPQAPAQPPGAEEIANAYRRGSEQIKRTTGKITRGLPPWAQ